MERIVYWLAIAIFVLTCANAYVDIVQAKEIERLYKSTTLMQEYNGKRFSDVEYQNGKLLEAVSYLANKEKNR